MRFEALRETLLRGGIAPRHVRRYLAELTDHLDDLTARLRREGCDDADAQARVLLGDDRELANAMLAQRQFRALSARAPWLVFGIAPLFAMILASLIPIFGVIFLMRSHGLLGKHPLPPPEWLTQVTTAVVHADNLLAGPLVAVLFVFIAWRQRINPVWPLVGIAIVLLLFVHMDIGMPYVDPHPSGSFALGLRWKPGYVSIGMTPIFLHAAKHIVTAQWPWVMAQYLLTLLPLAWLYRTQKRAGTCEA